MTSSGEETRIRVECELCGKLSMLPPSAHGKRATCNVCGHEFIVGGPPPVELSRWGDQRAVLDAGEKGPTLAWIIIFLGLVGLAGVWGYDASLSPTPWYPAVRVGVLVLLGAMVLTPTVILGTLLATNNSELEMPDRRVLYGLAIATTALAPAGIGFFFGQQWAIVGGVVGLILTFVVIAALYELTSNQIPLVGGIVVGTLIVGVLIFGLIGRLADSGTRAMGDKFDPEGMKRIDEANVPAKAGRTGDSVNPAGPTTNRSIYPRPATPTEAPTGGGAGPRPATPRR